MTGDSQEGTFVLGVTADTPAIVGATWWNEALRKEERAQSRRKFLVFGAVVGGVVAVGSLAALAIGEAIESNSTKDDSRRALEMQEQYGWSFGATTEPLVYDPGTQVAAKFPADSLRGLPSVLRPRSAALAPFFVPTLFQSSLALPTAALPDEPLLTQTVSDELYPLESADANDAESRGRSFAAMLQPAPKNVAVIVDLPGPESVAFAAGAADIFAPVFTFDNWPHPRGVVPAHKTLAMAAGYQSRFVATAAARATNAAPLFVLDRNRLAPYDGATTHFDNRYLARLPSPDALHQLGYPHVLYICPAAFQVTELDDLNDLFVAYAARGVKVHALGVGAISQGGTDGGWYYGGTPATQTAFFTDYPFWPGAPRALAPSGVSGQGSRYVPTPRKTVFSGAAPDHAPANFALVPVVLTGAGILLGAKMNRFGSWNRSGGGWGGG